MRALRTQVGAADAETTWESFLLRVIRQGPLPDFWLYGEPYPALNGIVLTPAEHEALVGLTEQFAGIFHKALRVLSSDPSTLERLGFPWVVLELLRREADDTPFILGRFDFVLDAAGAWQLLEYNADTPSGAREAVIVERLIARSLGTSLQRTGRRLGGALRRAFGAALFHPATAPRDGRSDGGRDRPARGVRETGEGADSGELPGRVLGIVTDAGYAEDLGQAVFLARHLAPALARRGATVVFADIDNLSYTRGRLRLLGRPLDALYRYYPFETLLGRQGFVDLFAAVTDGRLHLLNGLRGLLAQNKGVLAWLWAHRADGAVFTAGEQRTIQAHLPPVRWIDAVSPAEDRRTLVLKQVFGREGEEVYFGDHLSAADWERCRAWGSYVVQQRVDVAPLDAVVRTSVGSAVHTLWPVVGSFVVRRRWAGYYTRLGAPITTASAKFVGTFCDLS